jgi:hypothetical protein
LGDELVSAESHQSYGVNQLPDDIGIASDGRLGPYERAARFGVGKRQEVADAEDAEELLGSEVRTLAFWEPMPACGQDVYDERTYLEQNSSRKFPLSSC